MTAASARYGVTCPFCGAKPHVACRTRTGRTASKIHVLRLDAANRKIS